MNKDFKNNIEQAIKNIPKLEIYEWPDSEAITPCTTVKYFEVNGLGYNDITFDKNIFIVSLMWNEQHIENKIKELIEKTKEELYDRYKMNILTKPLPHITWDNIIYFPVKLKLFQIELPLRLTITWDWLNQAYAISFSGLIHVNNF